MDYFPSKWLHNCRRNEILCFWSDVCMLGTPAFHCSYPTVLPTRHTLNIYPPFLLLKCFICLGFLKKKKKTEFWISLNFPKRVIISPYISDIWWRRGGGCPFFRFIELLLCARQCPRLSGVKGDCAHRGDTNKEKERRCGVRAKREFGSKNWEHMRNEGKGWGPQRGSHRKSLRT